MATKRSAKKAATKAAKKATPAGKSGTSAVPHSMPKGGKDPRGGLTAEGRAYFAKTEGAHLKPGVQGPADTPEKMVRKGSFLRRHFANPRGPMKDDKGEPTRLALSAHAWGEEVPQTTGDAKELADEGHELLEQYHAVKDGKAGAAGSGAKRAGKAGGTKAASKKGSAKKAVAKKSAAKKGATRKPAGTKKAVKKSAI